MTQCSEGLIPSLKHRYPDSGKLGHQTSISDSTSMKRTFLCYPESQVLVKSKMMEAGRPTVTEISSTSPWGEGGLWLGPLMREIRTSFLAHACLCSESLKPSGDLWKGLREHKARRGEVPLIQTVLEVLTEEM